MARFSRVIIATSVSVTPQKIRKLENLRSWFPAVTVEDQVNFSTNVLAQCSPFIAHLIIAQIWI